MKPRKVSFVTSEWQPESSAASVMGAQDSQRPGRNEIDDMECE
jgi:hypothetical protein